MRKQVDRTGPDALELAPWISRSTSRRQALRWLAGASAVPLVGCSSEGGDAPLAGGLDGSGAVLDAGGATTLDASGEVIEASGEVIDGGGAAVDAAGASFDARVATEDAASEGDAGSEVVLEDAGVVAENGGREDDAAVAVGWASGGTAAMTAKASYPDPFGASLTACALVATTTEGPCTTASDLAREDVSEGWSGAPGPAGGRQRLSAALGRDGEDLAHESRGQLLRADAQQRHVPCPAEPCATTAVAGTWP